VDQPVIAYEAKYGWNRQSVRVIVVALLFCLAALLPAFPLWLKILDLAFFGGGAIMFAVISLRRTTAIRVDETGVTLCASPVYPKSTTRRFPWEDVVSLVIWRATFSGRTSKLDCVGVERRPGAPRLTGKFSGRRAQAAARLEAPGVPPEVAVMRAAANGWVLDRDRLAAAVERYGPGVRVIDTTIARRPGGN
jgi:hypothetical protein